MSISIPDAADIASRLEGVAPLAVFFDATGVTSTEASRPFHHCYYKWNFGDSNSGAAWAYGTRTAAGSKNVAYGPVAAHVFENAGEYEVTLTVFDGAIAKQTTITITVANWVDATHGDTACFSNDTDHTGAPAGADTFDSVTDFDAAINTTADGGNTYKRILFKRGDTFTTSTPAVLDVAGPGIVGAYGTGDKPVIDGATSKIIWSRPDWRVMDLTLDAETDTGEGFGTPALADVNNDFSNFLALRVDIIRVQTGFHVTDLRLSDFAQMYDGVFLVDSTITNLSDYAFIGEAERLAIMGCQFNDNSAAGQHLMRTGYVNKAIWSNNEFGATGIGQRLTIRSTENFTDGTSLYPAGTYTEQVLVSENQFLRADLSFVGSNRAGDDRWRKVIFENNYVVQGGVAQHLFWTEGGDITIRNNLFNMTGAGNYAAILIQRQTDPDVDDDYNDNIEVLHNTTYSVDTSSNGFDLVLLHASATTPDNLKIQNNLTYLPNITGTRNDLNGTAGTGSTVGNNTDGTDMAASPSFVGTPDGTFTNWQITASSTADGTGADGVKVFDDFFRAVRDWETPNTDQGAHALDAGALPSAAETYGAIGGLA